MRTAGPPLSPARSTTSAGVIDNLLYGSIRQGTLSPSMKTNIPLFKRGMRQHDDADVGDILDYESPMKPMLTEVNF
jgi:hypothetical protein